MESIKVLDMGYVKHIESWGHGDPNSHPFDPDDPDHECGIIEAARQSTQGSFRGWDQDERLLKFMYSHHHSTPFEFAGMVIEVQAPIFVFREWHRHRTQSYNEMSARYAPLPDINYLPTQERCLTIQKGNKQAEGMAELTGDAAMKWLASVEVLYAASQQTYLDGLRLGVPKELARIVLPVGRYSRMRASANLRNWLAFLTLRMHPDAQWEIRQFANAVGKIIAAEFPRTWSLFSVDLSS
jgi:thymidylate synthase (FAD)